MASTIEYHNPTITLAEHEIRRAIHEYLATRRAVPEGLQLGNIVKTNLYAANAVGSRHMWLTGTLTFDLLPEVK